MMILVLAKLVKLSWLEPETTIRSAILELPRVTEPGHLLIIQKAIEQTIIEMTYSAKSISLSINRRISVSFREISLKQIFENNIRILENHSDPKIIETTLSIYHKCLTFD